MADLSRQLKDLQSYWPTSGIILAERNFARYITVVVAPEAFGSKSYQTGSVRQDNATRLWHAPIAQLVEQLICNQ